MDSTPPAGEPLQHRPDENTPALMVLQVAAFVLIGVFLVSVLLRSLPLRLADPLWQVTFVTSVIDMGGYALLGVVVLTVAHLLRPGRAPLLRRLKRVAWLSRFAALGYLLLVPLLISALVRDYSRVQQVQLRQLELVSQTELRGRAALRAADSRTAVLQAVQGFNQQALPSLLIEDVPLDALRRRGEELLQRNVAAARQQLGAPAGGGLPAILFGNLRLMLLALLFAFGFSTVHTGWPSFPLLGALLTLLAVVLPGGRGERGGEALQDDQDTYFQPPEDTHP